MRDETRLSPERRAAMGEWLQAHIGGRRRRRRRRAAAVAVGAGAVAFGLAAGLLLAPSEVRESWVECHAAADRDSYAATAVRDTSGGSREAYALSMCRLLGEEGLVDGTPRDTAPELVLCQHPDLSLAAFPRGASTATAEDFCVHLGLRTPAG